MSADLSGTVPWNSKEPQRKRFIQRKCLMNMGREEKQTRDKRKNR